MVYSKTPPYTATSVIRSPRYYGPFFSRKKPSLISYSPVWVKGKNVCSLVLSQLLVIAIE